MIADFRRNGVSLNLISIIGEDVSVIEEYKYLGVHLERQGTGQ